MKIKFEILHTTSDLIDYGAYVWVEIAHIGVSVDCN
jgi:hypothetical protein